MPRTLPPEFVAAAIDGFQEQKKRIDAHIAELRQMLGDRSADREQGATATAPRKRRPMSAAARARIAAAQRKRWAATRTAGAAEKQVAKPPRKRRLSAASRKAIIEATKRRWAAVRAARKA